MVHVPFFNFDIPEPRLAELLPRAASAALRGATAACDACRDALFPLTPEQRDAHERALVAALPRELRRAHKRILLQGNERDALAVSSELEDASFAYYRRQLRTAVAGRSDEDTDDAAWRRLVSGGDAVREASRAARRRERAAVVGAVLGSASGGELLEEEGTGEGEEVERAAAAAPWRQPGPALAEAEEAKGRGRRRHRQGSDLSLAGGLSSGAAGLAVGAAAVELCRLVARGWRNRARERARERRRRLEEAEAEERRAAAAARRRRRGPGGVPRAPRPTMGGP
jgi:hypothetical protein